MEENEPQRPQSSGEESNQAILPLLQPPANQLSHTITNFYIDNILRPDFGRNRKEKTSVTEGEDVRIRGRTKPGNPQLAQRGGEERDPGASAGQHPESDPRRPHQKGTDPADTVHEEGRNRSREAGASPAAKPMLWPAWIYCTRYSDRPSSGPRCRKPKKAPTPSKEDKRPRTAFTPEQLHRLKSEFQNNRYLTEQRRQDLARDLGLNESQIKIWFQNKRAKIKKASGNKNSLALHLMAQGLYNHSACRDGKSDSE